MTETSVAGSRVTDEVTDEQVREIEAMVNGKIRENIGLDEVRNMPIEYLPGVEET